MPSHLEGESLVDLDRGHIEHPPSLNGVRPRQETKTYLGNLCTFNGLTRAVKDSVGRDLLLAAHD